MQTLTIKDITTYLEQMAPPAYQESYDNAGLICGQGATNVTGILISLDCTEDVVEEAIRKKANLIIAHHPIVFRGLKRLNGNNYVERTVIKAIRNDVAIYAIHTNLDNVHTGVNRRICEKIGLQNLKILSPRTDTLSKLVTFIPEEHTEPVMAALHQAGAGNIGNYRNCSFRQSGTGTFEPGEDADPFIGTANQMEFVEETRAELIFPAFLEKKIVQALKQAHPYEEVAYYITRLTNENQEVGAGMTGELDTALEPMAFLKSLKEKMNLVSVRYTRPVREIKKVAVCGGSGSFLLSEAIRSGADAYISADFKYHEFFDADGHLMIADIGHYESEVFTKELLKEVLTKKFTTFAINFSEIVTNPISYL